MTRIKLDNKDVSITPQQYDLMQKYGQNGYKPSYDDTNENFVFTREYESKEDKQGRKTKTKDVFTLDNAGGYSTTTQETIDREGKTIGLKEIRSTKLWIIETTYTVKDGSVSYQDYIESRTDPLTGKPIQYTFTKDNVRYTIDYEKDKALIDGKLYDLDKLPAEIPDDVKKALNQNKNNGKKWSSQRFFANVERIFTEFRGLGYYATLFWDDDFLLKWRDNVDRAFASAYLGTEYWTSAICSDRLAGEQEGVAFAETPQGLAQVGAHIEATRTQPIKNEKGEISYIYKITFQVRNGDYEKDIRAPENMSINAIIGSQMQTEVSIPVPRKANGERLEDEESKEITKIISKLTFTQLFKKDRNIGRGTSFGKMGRSAIVKETKILYTDICLTFDKIPLKWKLKTKDDGKYILCNKIQESPAEPTKLKEQSQGTDEELNDF